MKPNLSSVARVNGAEVFREDEVRKVVDKIHLCDKLAWNRHIDVKVKALVWNSGRTTFFRCPSFREIDHDVLSCHANLS
jgi:hypothetical protein